MAAKIITHLKNVAAAVPAAQNRLPANRRCPASCRGGRLLGDLVSFHRGQVSVRFVIMRFTSAAPLPDSLLPKSPPPVALWRLSALAALLGLLVAAPSAPRTLYAQPAPIQYAQPYPSQPPEV